MFKLCPRCNKAKMEEVLQDDLSPYPFLLCRNCYNGEKECPVCGKMMSFTNSGVFFEYDETRKKWRYNFICMNFDCNEFNKLNKPIFVVK